MWESFAGDSEDGQRPVSYDTCTCTVDPDQDHNGGGGRGYWDPLGCTPALQYLS